MTEKIELKCNMCKKIMLDDLTKWLKDNPIDKYLQCPYCNSITWRKLIE